MDISADQQALTVSELTLGIKSVLQADFRGLWVVGEVTDIARPRSGHIYLTLKDEQSQIRGVIWRRDVQRLKFPLEDGAHVVCLGDLDVYGARGTYQLAIREMQPRGEGAMQRALRELHARLAQEGLFDPRRKRTLPSFPEHVAIITSPSGAAIRDFLEVARRRWRGCGLTVIPTLVQGEAAVAQIVRALRVSPRLQPQPDVVVLTRGGGSMEDLWCFNSEAVVRAIHECPIPVVSAIGHDIDVTLSDHVADLRALTPTEAAERVVPDQEDVQLRLRSIRDRLWAAARSGMTRRRHQLEALSQRRVLRAPLERVHDLARRLDELEARQRRAMQRVLESRRAKWQNVGGRLEALSPLRVLRRGYSYTQHERTGEVLQSTESLAAGDRVVTTLANGRFVSTVEQLAESPSLASTQEVPVDET